MSERPTSTPERRGPLARLTVVDLTQHLSGPFATQILGDLGARIIKVEPLTGDPTRHIGPHFVDGDSAYYLSANRNKESICLNLKVPAGRDVLLELVRRSDVVVENFRPGTLERLGIGPETLKAVNPKIVVCSISGFGQDGPARDLPAFDMVVQALSGGMSLTGETGGLPVRSGLPIGDLCAGMYGVIGVLAALLDAQVEGLGSYVDVAMLDSQASMLSYVASYFLVGGQVAGLQGRSHMSIPTYRAFTCNDNREIVVAANTPRMWDSLCVALGVEELIDEPRFRNNDDRRANRDELDELLSAAAARWTSTQLLERLTAGSVPCAPINRIEEALSEPQLLHRDMVIEIDQGGTPFRVVGNPVKVQSVRTEHARPPLLGQHTAEVLRDMANLSDDQLSELYAAGAAMGAAGPVEGTA